MWHFDMFGTQDSCRKSPVTHLVTNDTWQCCLIQMWHMLQVWHPWPVSHCDIMWKKYLKMLTKKWNRCDTLWHHVTLWHVCDTLKVFKLIGPSNDGRRHGRGTYLFLHRRVYIRYVRTVCNNHFSFPTTTQGTVSNTTLLLNYKLFALKQVDAPTVPLAVIWGSNEDLWCHKCVIVSHCVKKKKKNVKKLSKKLSKSCQNVVKKLLKNCQKSCQKVVKNLS
jgi:hypothetical protein